MSFTMKLVLILFGLAYLISPVDMIPDLLLPWVGWIDDGVILWSIYYLIRYGELPWFLFKKNQGQRFAGRPASPRPASRKYRSRENNTGQTPGKRRQEPTHDKSPHDILGVPKTASWEEIQTAYKKKIKQYHPDKLSHLGKEFSDLASEKFLEIQTAYGILKEKRRP